MAASRLSASAICVAGKERSSNRRIRRSLRESTATTRLARGGSPALDRLQFL
jgi:hypothetical protein